MKMKVSHTYQDFIKYLRSNSTANIVNKFTKNHKKLALESIQVFPY